MSAGDDLIDLLFASSGIEQEIVAEADRIEVLPAFLPMAGSFPTVCGRRWSI